MRRTEQRQRSPQLLPRLLLLHLWSQSFCHTWVLPLGSKSPPPKCLPFPRCLLLSLVPRENWPSCSFLLPGAFSARHCRPVRVGLTLGLLAMGFAEAGLSGECSRCKDGTQWPLSAHSFSPACGLLFTTLLLQELSSEPGLKKKTARGRHSTKPASSSKRSKS